MNGKGAELAEVARVFFGSVFLTCWLEYALMMVSYDEVAER